jgi:hypothetical protein
LIDNTELVLRKLIAAGLVFSAEKAIFGASEAEVLGTLIGPYGRKMPENRVTKIETWGTPKRIRELRGFIAICNVSQGYVPLLAEKMEPLVRALRGKP